MTTKELKELEELLIWAKGKANTDLMFDRILEALFVVRRELRLLNHDFVKDVPKYEY